MCVAERDTYLEAFDDVQMCVRVCERERERERESVCVCVGVAALVALRYDNE